ncbi:MAG TPA: MerR family transcriptional regulator [Lachnospiraceae bacterium]|nr:MerR family transcriptional regulator [Lachnospiraceae bacterium]
MKINEMEKLSGISKKNIRFYEEQGLLSPQRNCENGYREYSMEDLEQIKKIKLLRKLCIPIEEIRNMQNATFTLSECMERHLIYLQREEKNILCTREMCKKIIESENMLESLDADSYLEVMNTMERKVFNLRMLVRLIRRRRLAVSLQPQLL